MAEESQCQMKSATIRDVARKAGVGLGTVSRVLNNSPSVSQATRERVLEVIEDLHYVPNLTARRLSLGKTLTIAVIVPFFTRPSFIERLRGIEHSLTESDYDLIIYNVETVKRRDECMREIPRRDLADGVMILSLSPQDDDIPYLERADVPIVLVDANHASLANLNRVIVDDVEGGRKATQHLIDLGHRKIGYISDYFEDSFNFTSSRDRFQGYLQALENAGIAFPPDFQAQGNHGRYEARLLAARMLSLEDRPTAIFAASDTQAMGVMEAARDLGISVPADLSIIGYDDIEIAEYLGLTTIRQMLYESGQRGVELLLNTLDSRPDKPVCEIMPTELVARKTTSAI
jgi:DNA-binding LacI/PurR family transcriptional regulator